MSSTPKTEDQLLTRDDVADRLQVSRRTVDRWIKDGRLAAVKVGRLVRIRPEALAALIRDGLLIALLSLRPLRRRNIAGIEIGGQLKLLNGKWVMVFAADETKTEAPLEFPWPDCLVGALEQWLERWRPVLLRLRGRWYRPAGDAFWISSDGSPMTQQAIYDRVVEQTQAAFGKAVNPHLARDCAASTWADADPDHVRGAARLLGHRTFATTERYYLRAKMGKAARSVQQVILDLRRRGCKKARRRR